MNKLTETIVIMILIGMSLLFYLFLINIEQKLTKLDQHFQTAMAQLNTIQIQTAIDYQTPYEIKVKLPKKGD